jgi:peptidyl-prolyl cis-trans isomerase SurA
MQRFFIAAILAICSLTGLSQTIKSKSEILFSVKGEPVTTDEFLYIYKKNHPNKDDFSEQKIQEYLTLFINFKLKVKEARRRGIDTTAAFLKEYNSYKEELKKPYLPEGKIIDSLVQVTYNRMQEEVRAAHILINCKLDASPADSLAAWNKTIEIKNRALAGEDFASLAALYSEEPNASISKGDLGYFTAMQMVFPFENAAYTAKKGDIVGPVRTKFGYHVLKIYDRKPSRGEVEVSHIMIRTEQGQDAAKAKNLIFEIYDQLRGGVVWNDLCKQYSEDQSSKNNGGKLRPFGVMTMASVPEFDKAAFALKNPGDVSDPIQTQYGWHIIKLERKIPLAPLEELTASLKNRVARDERVQLSRQALTQKLRRQFSFSENLLLKGKIISSADSTLTKGKWKIPGAYVSNKEVLFKLGSTNIEVPDFFSYVLENQKPTSQAPSRFMEQLYNAYVDKLINEKLETQIIASHPDFEMLLREYYEGILLFDIMEKEVWKRANEDSVGQATYFKKNMSKYAADERVDATVYAAPSLEKINSLKAFVETNDTISSQKMVQAKEIRVENGHYQRIDRPALAKIEWKPGLYTVESNRTYYLVQVKKIIPPGPLTFTEARASVISDYQDYLESEWLKSLKKTYPVKVNQKSKKHVVEKLKL